MKNNIVGSIFLCLGLVGIIVSGVFPPWTFTFKSSLASSEKPAGYAFIFNPPVPQSNDALHGVKIDQARLFAARIIIAAITSLGLTIGLLFGKLNRADTI